MPLHLLAVGDEAGHAVVGGVAEAGDNRGRLVAYAVDEDPAYAALGVAAAPHHVECNHHRHAHKGEGAHGEEEVDEEHPPEQTAPRGERREGEHAHPQQEALAECGEAQAPQLAEGGVAYDGAVNAVEPERYGRGREGAGKPRQVGGGIFRDTRDYEKHNGQHAEGGKERDREVKPEHNLGAQVAVHPQFLGDSGKIKHFKS